MAVNVEKLPEGTVIFEDIGTEKKRGKILKTLKLPQNTRQGDPLAGRIVYETLEGYDHFAVTRIQLIDVILLRSHFIVFLMYLYLDPFCVSVNISVRQILEKIRLS